jgi:hypothetical protein
MRGISVDEIGLKMGDNNHRVVKLSEWRCRICVLVNIVKIQMLVLVSVSMATRQSVMSHGPRWNLSIGSSKLMTMSRGRNVARVQVASTTVRENLYGRLQQGNDTGMSFEPIRSPSHARYPSTLYVLLRSTRARIDGLEVMIEYLKTDR